MEFDSNDPLTWFDDLLPEGFEWLSVSEGTQHLFGPDGWDYTQAFFDSWN